MSDLYPDVPIGDLELVGTVYKDCVAKFGRYGDGNLAIVIEDGNTLERIAVATVNVGMPGVFIKDYSENEGMLKQLVEKGLVEEIGATFTSGYVEIPEVRLKGAFADAVSPWNDLMPVTRGDLKEVLRGLHYGIGNRSIADSLSWKKVETS